VDPVAKHTDFAYHLTNYLTVYLPSVKNFSINTIHSYRDTFKLFLLYCSEELKIPSVKLQIQLITPDILSGFIVWLKSKRGNSVSSANQRLAVFHSFFRYLQSREPQYIFQYQQILSVEMAKTSKPMIGYLSVEDLQTIFEQTDKSTRQGRRDSSLLHLLYDSGARVQELCDLQVSDVHLAGTPYVLLHGKGNKSRYVPVMTAVAAQIGVYIHENGLNQPQNMSMPLFYNQRRQKLTRAGVSYIVEKYVKMARKVSSRIPDKVTPHIFRHTKAMHLCQAGIDIIYIRDILGHVDLATTEIYAKMNIESIRDALENAYPDLPTGGLPDWRDDDSLMNMLNSL